MTDPIPAIKQALKVNDQKQARQLVRQALKQQPSADLWVMAARLTNNRDQSITCLRKALELDEWHAQANRMLHLIEGSEPEGGLKTPPSDWQNQTGEKPAAQIQQQARPQTATRQRRRRWRNLGCLFYIILSFSCSMVTMRAVGFSNPVLTTLNTLSGGPTPALEFYGTPLAYYEQAAMQMTPVHIDEASRSATGNIGLMVESMEILDHGYMHEHTFYARDGEEIAIYVQFLSLNARYVDRHVALVDPADYAARDVCEEHRILQDNTNIAFICPIDRTGTWRVRIVGVDGESTGAYFVGVEPLGNSVNR